MHPENAPVVRDKVTRLMGVFRQLAAAKFAPTRHTDQYHATLWLDEAQRHGTLGAPLGPGDEVLRVQRVVLAAEPPRPAMLKKWLEPRRGDLTEPRLRSSGPVDGVEAPVEDAGAVRRAYDTWLEDWRRWAAGERPRRERKKVYDELFDVHRLAVEQPESVELVLATGLLQVPQEDHRGLRVHLVSQAVVVDQDTASGDMVCSLAPEFAPRLEDDEILAGLDGFDLSGSTVLRERLLDTVGTSLDPAVPEFLKEWAGRVLEHGHEFTDTWQPLRATGPTVSPSPAIVARRRGAYAIRAYYDTIIQTVGDPAQPVPLGLAQLVTSIEPDERIEWLDRTSAGSGTTLTEQPLFPLPANEEQAQIFDRLGHDSGVVVEGPPGTGKTHTIANLVSALLTRGQRVLVTSEKAQALRVLRDKLPAGMQELCVSLTDASAKGDSDLNRSVGTLAGRKADFNPTRLQREIDDLAQKRDASSRRRNELLEDIRAVREAETYVHPEIAPGFDGTLSRIADRLNETVADDGWLGSGVHGGLPLTPQELDELLGLLRAETPERASRRTQRLPEPALLPPPERYAELVGAIRAGDAVRSGERGGLVGALETLPPDRLQHLDPVSAQLAEAAAVLANLPQLRDWALHVTDRLLSQGDQHTWSRALAELPAVDEAVGRDRAAGFAQVTVHDRIDPRAAAAALGAWAGELENGGKLKRLLKSPEQKAAERYFDTVLVDGRSCSALPDARTAEHDLTLRVIATHLWHAFAPFGLPLQVDGHRTFVVEQLLGLRRACDAIVAVLAAVGKLREIVAALPPDRRPWITGLGQAQELAALAQGVAQARRAALARAELDPAAEAIRSAVPPAERAPEVDRLLVALAGPDEQEYGDSLRALQRAGDQVADQSRCDELYERAHRASASLAVELRRDPGDEAWAQRLRRWPEAWARSVAETWFAAQVEPGREQRLEAELAITTADRAKLTEQLAAAKAWLACLTRMSAEQVQALQAYRNQMANVGKGTGKFAERFRQGAREAMQVAQAAVPAWVMPIQQVLASVPPSPNAFDVVIVDEASQAELTSSFLLWLAPRVIVVGDDKQCTPSEVASGALQPIFDRIDTELHDFPSYLRSSFTPKDRIFSVLRSRFGQVIRLREHFRCMPEIITWCSNRFYRDAPLVPLRQFGSDRLPPLRTTYVRGAEAEGTASTVRNRAEADAIAASVAACVDDEAYDGKTFGIVVLQGHAQVEVIRNALLDHPKVVEQWDERRIRVGTPPDFQGDERHVVWLSLVRAPNSPASTLTRREFEQRFNVAVSRAQDQLWLFHSVTLDRLRPDDLRRQLLEYMTSTGSGVLPPVLEGVTRDHRHGAFDSLFEQRVFLDLVSRGYHVTPQVESNGRRIDLVVTGAAGKLAVECDGDAFHSTPEQLMNDLHREQELKRCGWTFERIRGSEYTLTPERALAPVWATLDRLGIGPLGEFTGGTWTPVQPVDDRSADSVDAGELAPTATLVEPRPVSPGDEVAPEPEEIDEEEIDEEGPYPQEPAALSSGPVAVHQRVDPALQDDPPGDDGRPVDDAALIRSEFDADDRLVLDIARRGPLTSQLVANLLAVGMPEARALLNRLVQRRELEKIGQRRGTRYVLPGADHGHRRPVVTAEQHAEVLAIAGAGRVTNGMVRERIGVDAQAANAILTSLVEEGALVRRGQARGTYYVRPET